MKKCHLKIPSKALICYAKEQAIRRNYVKYHIDKSVDLPSCGKTGEVISHIVSECSKLTQIEYKIRHVNVARMMQWKLCEKFNLENCEKIGVLNPLITDQPTTNH